ncbi:hypothetical protein L0P92_44390, partial [Streptomyces muensis]|nr:hypothetical protein [Streptomyces muensis]
VGVEEGAFGPAAQLLALIGLFAGVVAVREPMAGVAGDPGGPGGSSDPGAPTRPLPQRRRGRSPMGTEPPGSTNPAHGPDLGSAPRPESGPTVSARGPGGPDPDPPTARIGGKPRFRVSRPDGTTAPADPPEPEDPRKGDVT